MELETGYSGRSFVVRCLEDRIDAANSTQFRDDMRTVTAAASGTVILDLSRVEFLDSSGLGAVVAAMKSLAPDRRLELAAPTPNVQRVFRLTRMDTVFTIHPDVPKIGKTDAA